MKRNTQIEHQVDEALNSAKRIQEVEAPAFFTDRTMNRIKSMHSGNHSFSSLAWLKIAAIIVLAVVNLYTIAHIFGGVGQEINPPGQATIKDLVNEYQPSDSTEVTIENKIKYD
jgi:hypothetical protein